MDHDMGNMGNMGGNSGSSSDSSSMGAMGMFLNFKTTDFYILFEFWHVTTVELFIASIFIVGFLSFVNEVFSIHIPDLCKLAPKYDCYLNPSLLFIKMLINGLLMLVMMSFNGTLLITIVVAKVLAHIIFPSTQQIVECHE
eukprot:NODE_506_length_6690_cov_0.762858.p6 type:complete len:141 gc:universal NODE_506_length_6690_cov_0.762858:1964-1542(-)